MTELHSLLYSGMTLLSTAIIIMVWIGTLPSLSQTGPTTSLPTPTKIRTKDNDESGDISMITGFSMLGSFEYGGRMA